MNIFQVLSKGKGRLHEPSMSAMLGYLLDSQGDHGLGDSVVREFLKNINNEHQFSKILETNFIKTEVELEEPYSFENKNYSIDIQLSILVKENKESQESHRIIIENKINTGAAQEEQLKNYYSAVKNDAPDLQGLTFVFLTPNNRKNTLENEFNNLTIEDNRHKKYWIYWGDGDSSISAMLKNILVKEVNVEINPINEYMRHTLKSFIRHSDTIEQKNKKGNMRSGDLGEIIDEVDIKINSIAYTILKRDSGQIQIINRETENKEAARPKLLKFVEENNIKLSGALSQNTRSIGKRCIEWQKKTLKER